MGMTSAMAERQPSAPMKHRIESKAETDYESLMEPERVWYTVTRLLFNIRNGGLISYYYNGYAVHLDDCMRSLEILDAKGMLELVRRQNALFGPAVPRDVARVNEIIESWADDPKMLKRIEEMEREVGESDRELKEADAVEVLLERYSKLHGLET
jgi:hypothetical protein